jgi:hypothetical protein
MLARPAPAKIPSMNGKNLMAVSPALRRFAGYERHAPLCYSASTVLSGSHVMGEHDG